MPSRARGLRVPEHLEKHIAEEAAARGRSWSAVTTELLEEAVRMRRAPGVVFADGPAGRRAVVFGTGLDVWEIVAAWRASRQDFAGLRRDYEWLTEAQLQAALRYYELFPEEIDVRLEQEVLWTPERARREIPITRRRTGPGKPRR